MWLFVLLHGGREVLTTFPLETSAGWLLVQRRMLDESSLWARPFSLVRFVFFLGRVGPLVSLWFLDSTLFLFLGFISRFFFWRSGQSQLSGLFFLWQSRVANRSFSIGNEREWLGT